jgi:hypothetical protein
LRPEVGGFGFHLEERRAGWEFSISCQIREAIWSN